jgi:hypothetical protein
MTNGERKAVMYLRVLAAVALVQMGALAWLGYMVSVELVQARDNKIEVLMSEASSLRAAFAQCESKLPRKRK